MAHKGTDLERRVILDEYWKQEAENMAMAKAASGLLYSGLCGQKRDALRLSIAMFPAREFGAPDVRPKANA
jgi:hypothetical protein